MSAPFEPGDCVVCVDASGMLLSHPCNCGEVRRGGIYRILGFNTPLLGKPRVHLEQFPHDCVIVGRRHSWFAERFRKIDDEQYPEVLERLRTLPVSREKQDA